MRTKDEDIRTPKPLHHPERSLVRQQGGTWDPKDVPEGLRNIAG